MRRFLLSLAAGMLTLGALALSASSAQAGDPYRKHDRLHDRLEHKEFHRELIHQDAHRYPMTWIDHERLHDALEHDAYHDALKHREFHRRRPYVYDSYHVPSGGVYYYVPAAPAPSVSFGYQGKKISVWIVR